MPHSTQNTTFDHISDGSRCSYYPCLGIYRTNEEGAWESFWALTIEDPPEHMTNDSNRVPFVCLRKGIFNTQLESQLIRDSKSSTEYLSQAHQFSYDIRFPFVREEDVQSLVLEISKLIISGSFFTKAPKSQKGNVWLYMVCDWTLELSFCSIGDLTIETGQKIEQTIDRFNEMMTLAPAHNMRNIKVAYNGSIDFIVHSLDKFYERRL